MANQNTEYRRQNTGSRHVRVSPGHARRRGIAMVWTAIFLVLIILLMGLSLDTGRVALVMHQMHNAADGAALAGAAIVREDPNGARIRAQSIAQANLADHDAVLLNLNQTNDPNGDIVIGWYNRQERTFTPSSIASPAANAVAVITTRSEARSELGGAVPLIFGGPLAGVPSSDVTSRWQTHRGPYAIAVAIGGTGAGLIALADTGRGLSIAGNGDLNVMPIPPALPGDGEVQINSTSEDALHVDGGPDIIASAINVTGELEIGNYDLTPPFNSPAPPIPDPLAWLEPPTSTKYPDYGTYNFTDLTTVTKIMVGDVDSKNQPTSWPQIEVTKRNYDSSGNPIPWELYPGYYGGGFIINVKSDGTNPAIHFNPGVYMIGGSLGEKGLKPAGLVLDAGSYVRSDEATFYITRNADGSDYGVIDIDGQAGFRATEPGSGYYSGVTFFQDRDNTNPVTLHGSTGLDLDGTLYFPSADPIYLRGGGDGFGNQLIGWKFDVSGTTEIGIQYDGRNRSPSTGSFIVE